MSARNSALVLNVRRSEPELVRPARPTPNELKPLSDMDDLPLIRVNIPIILAYEATTADRLKDGKDPSHVMKEALAEALVYYYPWAGRLREGPDERLLVDCTAEGVVFVEADADVRLDQFGEEFPLPPFPGSEELLYIHKASDTYAVVGCPMFAMQLTRLVCGGFIVAFNFNHVMSDSVGVVRFLNAVAELAQGASTPSILPVWRRELLYVRDPPRVTCTLPTLPPCILNQDEEQDKEKLLLNISLMPNMVSRTFIFSDGEFAALRGCVPQHLQPCTSFELISACIWRCRTIALQYPPQEQVRLEFSVNIRNKYDPPLPAGHYGNALAIGVCISPAGEICNRSFGYAVEIVKKAKAAVTEEYVKSCIDLTVLIGRRLPANPHSYIMSDVSFIIDGFPSLDFGWGKPIYAGPPNNGYASHFFSFILRYGDGKGKVLSVSLPKDAMDRFVNALGSLLDKDLPL